MVASQQRLIELVKSKAVVSRAASINALVEAAGNAKVVMIGEMTHGSKEFYQFRAELTKQLIQKKGFSFVAAEGDWPDCYRIDRYARMANSDDATSEDSLGDFKRFPKWMWRNEVVNDFVKWLKGWNDVIVSDGKMHEAVGFYGLDLYSLFRSADAVIEYLEKVDSEAAERARRRYGTLNRYRGHEERYAYDVALHLSPDREKEVLAVLRDLLMRAPDYIQAGTFGAGYLDGAEFFNATENSHVVIDAEKYYRHSMLRGESTWNLRDSHMVDTLEHLIAYHSTVKKGEIKAVIWAHNSHLGDSRATAYSDSGEFNIGQLVRERFGITNCFNVGFTTSVGTVTAANKWGGETQTMVLNEPAPDTYEHVFHSTGLPEFSLVFRKADGTIPSKDLDEAMKPAKYERMIGVQYVKATERSSHYIKCSMPRQFDSIVHIERTSALKPL